MAKGNVILGTATGSIGDVTMYRRSGSQVSRVRVRKVGNPKSTAQALQRAILTLVSRTYSRLSSIANHSFQGLSSATANQSRFLKLNMDLAREAARLEILGQAMTEQIWNFLEKQANFLLYNSYKISEGTLTNKLRPFNPEGTEVLQLLLPLNFEGMSYQQVCDAIGCQPGDQVTFVALYGANPLYSGSALGVSLARVIMEPSSGGMATPFLNAQGGINSPNQLNEGSVAFSPILQDTVLLGVTVTVNGLVSTSAEADDPDETNYGALAIVVSRKEGGVWKRSSESFLVNPAPAFAGVGITDVIGSYQGDGTPIALASDKYLDNAQHLVV